jgi:hypothetical protein
MAIIAGAGNPTGGSGGSGIGQTLNYVGDFVYAYSGAIENAGGGSGSPSTMLQFTTGSELIKAKLVFGVQFAGANDSYLLMYLNDQQVMGLTMIETGQGGNAPPNDIDFMITPFSKVSIQWGIDGVTKNGFAMLSGRVYQ